MFAVRLVNPKSITIADTGGLPKDAVVELWKEHGGDASVLDATVTAGWSVFYTSPDWYFDHGKTLTVSPHRTDPIHHDGIELTRRVGW